MKKKWGIIKNITNKNQKPQTQSRFKIGDNLITSDKNIICDKFNDFFVNTVPMLAKSIPKVNKSHLSYMGNRLTDSIYLELVTDKEINTLISALKDTATGFDDMNSMSLKIYFEILVKPLTNICNWSLTQGIFPSQLKIANDIPLYKSDDPMLFNNYRPVFVLCVLSKVFLKKICIIEFQPSLKYLRYYMKINMAFEKNHLPIWRCFHSKIKLYKLLKKVNILLLFSLIFQKPLILLTMIFCWTN